MANYARIEILFTDIPNLGEQVGFSMTYDDISPTLLTTIETAQSIRSAPNTFSINYDPSSPISPIIQVAINFRDALLADTLIGNINILLPVLTVDGYASVIIEANFYDNVVFSFVGDGTNVSAVITPEDPPAATFGITGITSQPPQDNPACTYQRLVFSVENETYPIQIKHFATGSEVTKVANDASELWIEVPRIPDNNEIYLTSNYGSTSEEEAEGEIPYISLYRIFEVQVFESLSGASINIVKRASFGDILLSLQYSLDGVNWQSSPQFSGLLGGNYTAYMIDSYGCISTKDFTVEGLSTPRPDPYFKIEKANPLRFVNSATQTYKTVENTLFSDQYPPNIEHRYWRQPWNIGDVIRTQIKTSYRNLSVNVINDCTGEVTQTITPTKKTSYIGQVDKRDGIMLYASASEAYVYFSQGNIYDPDTGDVINTYVNSTGQLPSFAEAGIIIETAGNSQDGTFEVKDIVYNDSINAWCMLIDWSIQANNGEDVTTTNYAITVTSYYNAEDFDVYEFNFTENEGQYHVEITATDETSTYEDLLYISEPIWFAEHENLVHIQYSSDDNQSGIIYDTGIVFEINVPGRFFEYSAGGEDESFEDDYGRKIIQKAVYITLLTLETSLIPKWMAERIMIASLHDQLYIDGIEVLMNERPEIESKVSSNNPFYVLTGQYQLSERVVVEDSTGIVSGSRSVLGTDNQTVIGV